MTREEWLERAAEALRAEVKDKTKLDVAGFRVSVGFPKGARGRSRVVGQCWPADAAEDGRPNVFICPTVGTAYDAVETLLHEMVHVVAPGSGHRGEFVRVARALGFTKPWLSTPASADLKDRLVEVLKGLPAYPHGALVLTVKEKKGSRLRLWECECGVKVRVASDAFHATCDDCGEPFEKDAA